MASSSTSIRRLKINVLCFCHLCILPARERWSTRGTQSINHHHHHHHRTRSPRFPTLIEVRVILFIVSLTHLSSTLALTYLIVNYAIIIIIAEVDPSREIEDKGDVWSVRQCAPWRNEPFWKGETLLSSRSGERKRESQVCVVVVAKGIKERNRFDDDNRVISACVWLYPLPISISLTLQVSLVMCVWHVVVKDACWNPCRNPISGAVSDLNPNQIRVWTDHLSPMSVMLLPTEPIDHRQCWCRRRSSTAASNANLVSGHQSIKRRPESGSRMGDRLWLSTQLSLLILLLVVAISLTSVGAADSSSSSSSSNSGNGNKPIGLFSHVNSWFSRLRGNRGNSNSNNSDDDKKEEKKEEATTPKPMGPMMYGMYGMPPPPPGPFGPLAGPPGFPGAMMGAPTMFQPIGMHSHHLVHHHPGPRAPPMPHHHHHHPHHPMGAPLSYSPLGPVQMAPIANPFAYSGSHVMP